MTPLRPRPFLLVPVLLCFALLGLALGDYLLLPALGVLILASYLHRLTLKAPDPRRPLALAARAGTAWGVCWLHYALALGWGSAHSAQDRALYGAHLLATGGLLAALLLGWLWHTPGSGVGREALLLALAGLVTLASGNFYRLGLAYLLLLGFFFLAYLGSLASLGWPARLVGREGLVRGAVLAVCLGTVGGLGGAVSLGINRLERLLTGARIEGLSLGLPLLQGGLGVSRGMRVERHKRARLSTQLLATVDGETSPGYLRAGTLSAYRDGHFRSSPGEGETLAAGQAAGGSKVYRLPSAERPGEPTGRRRVTMFADLGGVVPLAYGTRSVDSADPVKFRYAAAAGALEVDPSGLLGAYGFEAAQAEDDAGGPGPGAVALEVPPAVAAALRKVAQEVAGEGAAARPLEAASRLESWFRQSFRYSLEVDLADEGDPVVDFVVRRRPGYCEHFAAGMVLLLRSLGIPARVATGFLVSERNTVEEAWVVRKRDAHAWTEAWDGASGRWVAFDATPPGGLEEALGRGSRGRLRWLLDWVRFRRRDAGVWWHSLRPGERLAEAWGTLRTLPGRTFVPAALAAALGLVLLWRRRRTFARALGRLRVRLRRGPPRGARGEAAGQAATRAFARLAEALERASARGPEGAPGPRAIGASESVEEYLDRAGRPEPVSRFLYAYREARFRPEAPARALEPLVQAAVEWVEAQGKGR